MASQRTLRLTLPWCSGCLGGAEDMLRHAQECSPSAQVKAAAAHVQILKRNRRKKKVESDLSDQTPWSAMKRVSLHAEEEINRFKNEGWRVRIVNTWRPITSQVSDWPLALCDARSVSNAELIAVDHVRRRYVGESYYMPFNAAHRWYYLSRQTKDEVLLFKNYDSREDLDGKYCPHASFRQSNGDPMATPRCSIEVRALVFSEQ